MHSFGSSKPGVAAPDVPSLLLPAGTKQLTFTITTQAVTAKTSAKITATANGITKGKALVVNP
jgi:hypothetical protein